jgi:hypothetical protein
VGARGGHGEGGKGGWVSAEKGGAGRDGRACGKAAVRQPESDAGRPFRLRSGRRLNRLEVAGV